MTTLDTAIEIVKGAIYDNNATRHNKERWLEILELLGRLKGERVFEKGKEMTWSTECCEEALERANRGWRWQTPKDNQQDERLGVLEEKINTLDIIGGVVRNALNDCSVVNKDRDRAQQVGRILSHAQNNPEIVVNITGLITEGEFEKRVLEVVANALK